MATHKKRECVAWCGTRPIDKRRADATVRRERMGMGDGVGECLTAKISIVPAVMPKTPFCAELSMPPVLRTMIEERVVSEAFRRGGVRVGVCGVGGGCMGEHVA